MASLTGLIQHIVQQVIQASKLCDVCYGTVKSTEPLEVELEQTMLDLPEECLILTDSVKRRVENAGDAEIVVQHNLKKGDKVAMIRAAGGQQFLIISVV